MNKLDKIPEWGALGMVMLAMAIVARLALAGNETALGANGVKAQGSGIVRQCSVKENQT